MACSAEAQAQEVDPAPFGGRRPDRPGLLLLNYWHKTTRSAVQH